MAEPFLINPDYQNFVPPQAKIKLSTLEDVSGCRGCLAIFLLPVSLFLIAGLIRTFAQVWEFRQQGVMTEGTITRCEQPGGSRSVEIYLFYTYTVNSKVYNDTDVTDPASTCQKFPQGSHVPIQYLASRPEESVYMAVILPYQWSMINLFGLISLAGLLFIFWHFKKLAMLRKRVHRLKTEGQLIEGKITYAEKKKVKYGIEIKMWYAFVPPHQFIRDGVTSKHYPQAKDLDLEDFVGKTLSVLYAADDCYVAL